MTRRRLATPAIPRPGAHAHLADLAIRGSAPACSCPATAATIALGLTLRRIRDRLAWTAP